MISAVIPTYNDPPERLAATVAACLAVVERFDGEVVVVDDGSEQPASVPESGARLVRLGKNSGCPAAMNAGVEAAAFDVIARCDCGDFWYPEAKESQLALMLEREHEATFSISRDDMAGETRWIVEDWEGRIFHDNQFQASTTAFTKDAFEAAGRYDSALRYADDWGFAVRVQHFVGWAYVPVVTGSAHCHVGGISHRALIDKDARIRRRADIVHVRRMAEALGRGVRPA
jgi:glycosyltransferase involved in cell wall biosynthesis